VSRSFLELEQIAVVLQAADEIEARHRGLTWDAVDRIRRSDRSAVALAREFHVSDTLIRRVRRGELWNGERGPRNRNHVRRHAIVEVLLFAGLRISELCDLRGRDVGGILETNLSRHLDPDVLDGLRQAGAGTFKTVEQGAATSVLVATSPQLEGIGGRYFEDCNEAVVVEPSASEPFDSGVAAYALDPDNARRLWELSENLTRA
jgi:hypothetical protein